MNNINCFRYHLCSISATSMVILMHLQKESANKNLKHTTQPLIFFVIWITSMKFQAPVLSRLFHQRKDARCTGIKQDKHTFLRSLETGN